MSTDPEQRDKAKFAAQAGNFQEAIKIYRSLWSVENRRDLWDARGLVSSLRKSGDFEGALAVGREAIALDPSFDPVASELSWAIWQSAIKGIQDRISDHVVEEVVRLREAIQDPYSQYAAFTRILLDVAKIDLEKNNAQRSERLTAILDPHRLNAMVNTFEGKTLPSERQRYYNLRGKVLKSMGRWSELEQFGAEVARDTAIKWANDGNVWIERWRIEAIFEQDRVEEALDLTNKLVKRLDEWYIHADLAQYLHRLDRHEEALVEALKSACGNGPFDFKVNAFKLLAELLEATGQPEMAGPFAQAAISIRTEKGWAADAEVAGLCDRIGWTLSGADIRSVQRDVVEAVAALVSKLDPPMRGEVTKILPSGRSGFIKDDNGVDRFFGGRDIALAIELLAVGLRVTFRPTTSFDKKKNRETDAATDVRIVQ